MFSSVANYLFGSSQPEEEPVKEMELETSPAKDDDWLIVNVQGGPSSQVPMSEMENLLIEHPSMSVYNSHCSRGSSGEDSNLSESSNDNFSNVVAKRGLRPRNSKGQVVRQAPRRPNAVAARCGILAQAEAYRSAQRVKQYKETRNLSNGSLDRHNKNMIRNGKKYSQKNRIQTPSARTFNNKQMKHWTFCQI